LVRFGPPLRADVREARDVAPVVLGEVTPGLAEQICRLEQLAEGRGEIPPAAWTDSCDEIADRLLADARRRGWFAQAWDADVPDAAALLVPAVGFVAASDPLVTETVRVIRAELADDGLVHRYKAEDGLRGGEGAFLLCSFWLVDNLVAQGRLEEAEDLYGSLCARASPLGLLSEQIDPATGELSGNFPQAFSHIGVIASGATLARARAGKAT
jgi:GH15 family glucan-1,4-alpha-glucosidase